MIYLFANTNTTALIRRLQFCSDKKRTSTILSKCNNRIFYSFANTLNRQKGGMDKTACHKETVITAT